jgi:maltose-binding protein MalE
MFEGTNATLATQAEPAKPLTRRQLLRTAAMGSAVLVGGSVIAACGGGGSTGPATVKVTFLTNGWPMDTMPTAAQQKTAPSVKAYADSLAKWLKQNPGVTLKHSTQSVWDTPGLTNAIAAGTAPTWFEGNVLGGFGNGPTRSAFARGLAADVTSLVSQYKIDDQLTSSFLPVWQSWKVDGKYYGTPGGYGVGDGVYFRRDLIQQAGLQEPTANWTWQDFRALAKGLTKGKMKGAALQSYIFSQSLGANWVASTPTGYGTLGLVPDTTKSWPWQFDLESWQSQYAAVVDNWRGMLYDDKSILADPAYGDNDVAQSFIRGDVAMMTNNTGFFTRLPSDPTSVMRLSTSLNKPFEDVIGWVSQPQGTQGSFGATQPIMAIGSIDPHFQRNPPALAKAFDFLVYMIIGQGAIDQTTAIYKATKDLKQVFLSVPPMTKNMVTYPGITGTAQDAWGAKTMQSVQNAANIPLLPDAALYFPTEKNAGPTGDAFNDAISGWSHTQKAVEPILKNLQSTENQQLSSLSSSVDPATFKASATKFYADLDAFWAKNAPDFSASTFHPWYQQKILPALGG